MQLTLELIGQFCIKLKVVGGTGYVQSAQLAQRYTGVAAL